MARLEKKKLSLEGTSSRSCLSLIQRALGRLCFFSFFFFFFKISLMRTMFKVFIEFVVILLLF